MDLEGLHILVVGLGMSGRSAARFCAERGARVVAVDERGAGQLGDLSELPSGVEVRTGGPLPDPADFDLVVPSPGVPRERWAAGARRAAGDIELAWSALPVPVLAVTGTNGKSTTVRLIEAMLQACGVRAAAAGNVGTPALSLVGQPIDAAVLEVSSFQLEAVEHFRPRVAVVLNVSPDHLDRHGDLAGYAAAKRRMLEQQTPDDVAVLNFDDRLVREMAAHTRARIVPFRRCGAVERGLWFDTGAAVWSTDAGDVRLPLDSLQLRGVHNLENVLAALAAVAAFGADLHTAVRALAGFRGLPHRCEVVAERGGVVWVNDSKATNPGAAARSLESFPGSVVWIAGGRDKDLAFAELAAVAVNRVKRALLIGEAAPALERALAGRVEVEHVHDLKRAVARAAALVAPGDVVLLAPACASFDQFASFEARGDAFREAVTALPTVGVEEGRS